MTSTSAAARGRVVSDDGLEQRGGRSGHVRRPTRRYSARAGRVLLARALPPAELEVLAGRQVAPASTARRLPLVWPGGGAVGFDALGVASEREPRVASHRCRDGPRQACPAHARGARWSSTSRASDSSSKLLTRTRRKSAASSGRNARALPRFGGQRPIARRTSDGLNAGAFGATPLEATSPRRPSCGAEPLLAFDLDGVERLTRLRVEVARANGPFAALL